VLVGAATSALTRVHLGKGLHDEAWLQALLHQHPGILPVADIEPGFGELVPVAREVPCGHGFVDNLYLTPAGEIVVVETKLWANPQARREVVAQALDYAAALSAMGYERFEAAVARALGFAAPPSLHALVADRPDALDEPAFVDAVAENLRRGRMLVIAAGDGVRREAEALASLLQGHAGAHFTFALVELAAYRVGDTETYLVVPATLARTVLVERGVVRIEDGRATIAPPAPAREAAGAAPAQSLTEAAFYELMAARDPGLPRAIRDFLASVEPLGVYAEYRASLNLKVEREGAAKPVNLGYVQKNGQLWTSAVGWFAPKDAALRYIEALAAAIGGEVAAGNDWSGSYVSVDGKKAPRIEQLLPAHAEAWRRAVETLVADLREADTQQPE